MKFLLTKYDYYDKKAVKYVQLLHKNKNEYLFKENDNSEYFYGIIQGKISIRQFETSSHNTKGGRHEEKIKVYLSAGECFGEWGLIYNDKRTASVFLEEESYFFILDKKSFEKSFKVS